MAPCPSPKSQAQFTNPLDKVSDSLKKETGTSTQAMLLLNLGIAALISDKFTGVATLLVQPSAITFTS